MFSFVDPNLSFIMGLVVGFVVFFVVGFICGVSAHFAEQELR